jgi:hypothetical protein
MASPWKGEEQERATPIGTVNQFLKDIDSRMNTEP